MTDLALNKDKKKKHLYTVRSQGCITIKKIVLLKAFLKIQLWCAILQKFKSCLVSTG